MTQPRDPINFLPSTHQQRGRWALIALIAATTAIFVGAWALNARAALADAVLKDEHAKGQQLKAQDEIREQQARSTVVAQQQRAWDQAASPYLKHREFDWDSTLLAIERLSVPGLRLQQLSVNTASARVAIEVVADTPDAVLTALQQLQGDATGVGQQPFWRIDRLRQQPNTLAGKPVIALLVRETAQ
jgi:hypothetical protein